MKKLLTLTEIEPATFRFVAQHLNHCATAVEFVVAIYTGSLNTSRALYRVVFNSNIYHSPQELLINANFLLLYVRRIPGLADV